MLVWAGLVLFGNFFGVPARWVYGGSDNKANSVPAELSTELDNKRNVITVSNKFIKNQSQNLWGKCPILIILSPANLDLECIFG